MNQLAPRYRYEIPAKAMENSGKIIHPMLLTANGSPQKMPEPELAARVLTLLKKMFLSSSYTFI